MFQALGDWKTGTCADPLSKYNTTVAEDEYSVVMGFLQGLQDDSPIEYHDMMHAIYLNVW